MFKNLRIFLILLLYAPQLEAKYQLCSITINSSNEINTFKRFLPAKDFDFIELVPTHIDGKQSSHWFNSACRKQLSCDILVISGHFGGEFFGESGWTLPTELMEEKACQKTCRGILSDLKEVFLFGCNTLANKQKDSRSYQEYLKVLLDDGLSREMAEKVVATRYSPLGTPFYARMNFIFSQSEAVYGFNQLSPLGQHIQRPLEKYFLAINKNFGSYSAYLKAEGYKRKKNLELFRQLSHTTLNQAQISLAQESQSERAFFQNKCLLYDRQEDLRLRLKALRDIFSEGRAGSAFFAIDYFLNQNKEKIMEGRGRRVFRSIRTESKLAQKFKSHYKHLRFLPYIRLVYLNVLSNFQWIDPLQLAVLRRKNLLEMIENPNPESYISLLLLLKNKQFPPFGFYISKQDLPKDYIQNIYSLLIFEKLKALAPDWQGDMMEYCHKNIEQTRALCYQVLNTLAHIQPRPEVAEQALEFLNQEDRGLIHYSLRLLGQSKTLDYAAHAKIASFLTHEDPWIRVEAIEALGYLKTPYEDIQEALAQLLSLAEAPLAEEILSSLSQCDIQSSTAQKWIIQYVVDNGGEETGPEKALEVLQNSSKLSEYSRMFFYDLLENPSSTDALLKTVELLSYRDGLKDLGIHFRFLQFQGEGDRELKKEILRRMAHLTWIHPETQMAFLDYLRDEDSEIRSLVVNILKNIENLRAKTLREMEQLYREENVLGLEEFFTVDI